MFGITEGKEIIQKVDQEEDWEHLLQVRRELHQNAELGLKEYKTSQIIMRELDRLGIPSERIYGTGVTAVIKGAHEGRTLLYRADMDALPIAEGTGLPFASKNPKVMHACGHDIHMICALGVAEMITRLKENMHGNLKLVFQPCEENIPGGAKQMIEEGILDWPKVDGAFAIHVLPDIPAGHYLAETGEVTAAPSWFEIEVIGRGGHASEPEKCINPLDSVSRIYQKIKELQVSYAGTSKKAVISPTMLHGGNAQNIIPDNCTLAGTVRTFCREDIEKIKVHLKKVCEMEEKTGDVKCTLHFRTSMNSVVNHPDMTRRMRNTICSMYGSSALEKREFCFMGGEDYAFISDRVPSVFLFAGSGNEDGGEAYPLHNSRFCPNERMIRPTVNLLCQFVWGYLGND